MQGIFSENAYKTAHGTRRSRLILREVSPEIPPRIEYSLTESGKTVLPVLDALCEWGSKYLNRECTFDKNEKKTADSNIIDNN